MTRMTLVALAVLTGLSACGGSGGAASDTAAPVAGTSSLSGKVVDGYLQGAEVCLDTNADKVCDTDKVLTDASGNYSLTHKLTASALAGAHVLVRVPETAKDADDGGKTLKEAGKAAFELLAPAAHPQVVSPLTTLVSEDMLSNGLTAAEAETKIVATLALGSGKVLLGQQADFVAAKDPRLQKLAQTTAILLGEVKKSVSATLIAKPGMVKPGEQLRVEVLAARQMLSSLLDSGANLETLSDGQKIDPTKVQSLLNTTLSTQWQELQSTDYLTRQALLVGSPSASFNISQLIGQTFFDVTVDGSYASVCRDPLANGKTASTCFSTNRDAQGKWATWRIDDQSSLLTEQGWRPDGYGWLYDYLPDTSSTLLMKPSLPLPSELSYVMKTKGAMSPQAWFPKVGFAAEDAAYPMYMSPKQMAYKYSMSGRNPISCFDSQGNRSDCASFAALRQQFSGVKLSGQNVTGFNWLAFSSFDGNRDVVAGFNGNKLAFYQIKRTANPGGGYSVQYQSTLAEEGSWKEEMVAGVPVLQLSVPEALKARLGLQQGRDPIYTLHNGKVYQGTRRQALGFDWVWLNASAFAKIRQHYELPVLPD